MKKSGNWYNPMTNQCEYKLIFLAGGFPIKCSQEEFWGAIKRYSHSLTQKDFDTLHALEKFPGGAILQVVLKGITLQEYINDAYKKKKNIFTLDGKDMT